MLNIEFVLDDGGLFGGLCYHENVVIFLYPGKSEEKIYNDILEETLHYILWTFEEVREDLELRKMVIEEQYGEDVFFGFSHNFLLGISTPEENLIKRFIEFSKQT